MSDWGLHPAAVRQQLRRREWDNRQHLKRRLLGERPLPIVVPLKAPSARQALADLDAMRLFIEAWRGYSGPGTVQWQTQIYRNIGEQQLPTHFELRSLGALFQFLGKDVLRDMAALEEKLQPLLALDRSLHSTLIDKLSVLDALSAQQTQQLATLLPQLTAGMGNGCYLRALPLTGVHSKFIEQHHSLIEALLDASQDNKPQQHGGLLQWLDCRDNPRGWLMLRPLCPATQAALAGLPLLQLDSHTLQHLPQPGKNILIVENLQSGLSLPPLKDTLAICGGGKNLGWMHNHWMQSRHIGYWGDIDSHGLAMLEQALQAQPHTSPLLMDRATLAAGKAYTSQDKTPCQHPLLHLGEEQQALYQQLLRADPAHNRLEQELIDSQTIQQTVQAWSEQSIT